MSEKLPETEAPTDQKIDTALATDQDSGQEIQAEPSPVEEVDAEGLQEIAQLTDGVPEATEKAADGTIADADDSIVASDLAEERQSAIYDPVKFEELALPEPLLNAITELRFEECTPIQGRTLPFSLSDYDVTGQAQTGTGKTAAFLITLFTRFWENPLQQRPNLGTPRALVLAPTRELALQIEGDAEGLNRYMDMRTVCVVGGMDFDRQRADLLRAARAARAAGAGCPLAPSAQSAAEAARRPPWWWSPWGFGASRRPHPRGPGFRRGNAGPPARQLFGRLENARGAGRAPLFQSRSAAARRTVQSPRPRSHALARKFPQKLSRHRGRH